MINNFKLIKKILESLEQNLNIRTGRSGEGHPYQQKGNVRQVYGKSAIEYEYEDEEEDDSELENEDNQIKISKAFHEK